MDILVALISFSALTYCGLVTQYGDIDLGHYLPGNGLLPDGANNYMNQCHLIITGTLWHSVDGNSTANAQSCIN